MQRWLRKIADRATIGLDGKVDLTEFREALQKALDGRLYEVLTQGGTDAIKASGARASMLTTFDAMREYFDAYTFATSATITETTRQAIEEAIQRVVEQGVPMRDAIRAIRDALPESAKARAEMIAQTEVSRAYGVGNMIGWVKSGAGWKQWKLAANPCPQCEALVAELSAKSATDTSLPERLQGLPVVPVDQPFTETDYGPVYSHPLHPRCYCDVLYVNETTEMTPEEADADARALFAEMKSQYESLMASVSNN